MKLHILLSIILLASLSLLGNEPTYIQTSAETIEFTKEGKLITVDSPHNSLFSQNNHLKAKIWDLTTKNPIVTYDTKEPLGKVYLSEDGLIANLDTREKQPILTII